MSAIIDEPVIVAAEIGPGHDGRPEVIVTLAYANGATSQLSLDQDALDHTDIADLSALAGQSWSVLLTIGGPGVESAAPLRSQPTHPEETSPCTT